MNVETQIKLDRFRPRSYQIPILDAIENKGYRRVLAILPRRAGKDITAFNLCIRQCLKKICVIYYIFPTYSQAKKVIWDSITNTGERILDFIPDELVHSKNSQEMKIRFKNGSLLQLVGSDNFDTLMGTNPQGVVFSEYALQDPRAYQFIRPILTANDGWAVFISTPRGKNHLWSLWQIATNSDDWFAYKMSVEDTQHIPLSEIEKERREGLMSEDLIMQEYYCSFDMGVEGSYYAKYLDRMRTKGQIGQVPWESGFKVHTAWDIGVRDSTTIIFFQVIGQTVRLIDCYENSKEGLEHYVRILESKPYSYAKHIAPHDIKVREFGSGITRFEKARQLGINFTLSNDVSIVDGIEAVRTTFSKMWIDEVACKDLIKAIENYRQEFDAKRKVYKNHPLHDWSSHFCFTGDTLVLTSSGTRPIMNVAVGDMVLTLLGWKKCLYSNMTKKNANLVEVLFKDGTKVRCTPDHLFLTESGWISAENLTMNTEIQSSLIQSHNTSTDRCTDYGPAKSISQKEDLDCTKTFGNLHLVLFQKIATFITKIAMLKTTPCGILNALPPQSTLSYPDLITKDSPIKQEKPLTNGTNQRKGGYGIQGCHSEPGDGQSGRERIDCVSIVQKILNASSERTGTSKNSVMPTAKPLTIESVRYLQETEDVYDIEVEDAHHFSLSNGAIVHNSDCMRYLCVSLPKTRDGASAEELDKRYQEAMYGTASHMPSVFRDDLPPY